MITNKWVKASLGLAGLGITIRLRAAIHQMTLNRLALLPRIIGERTPDQLGMPYQEVWFPARDGVRLHGWFISDDSTDRHNITIIMAHGHAGNKEPDLEYALFFYNAGYNVFMFDFRGHGRSEGPHGTSMGYWEKLDVHGAVDWLLGRGQDRLAAFGISMGASVLIMAAAENPYIRAVIADSPYAQTPRAIAAQMNNLWGVPMWITRLLAAWAWRIMASHHNFALKGTSPADAVAAIAPRPLLLIHGEADRLTRVENFYMLQKRAGQPLETWLQPRVGHVGGYLAYGREYERRILAFLDTIDWYNDPVLPAPTVTLDGVQVG